MQRYNDVIGNKMFVMYMKRLCELEEDRIFCRHDLTHLLDVCRVAYIFALEEQMCERVGGKDVIYAAGLIHDLGRVAQYESGTPHEKAGVQIAAEILPDCGYSDEEIACVQAAIGHHRKRIADTVKNTASRVEKPEAAVEHAGEILAAYLYRADKAVRNCFCCKAIAECNWDESRKNRGVI